MIGVLHLSQTLIRHLPFRPRPVRGFLIAGVVLLLSAWWTLYGIALRNCAVAAMICTVALTRDTVRGLRPGRKFVDVIMRRANNSAAPLLIILLAFLPLSELPAADFTSLPGFQPTGISGDGSTVVGDIGGQAAFWTATGGFQTIPSEFNANAVSHDGSVIVGARGFKWTSGSVQYVGLPGFPFSNATDVSADGSVVVGTSEGNTASTRRVFLATPQGTTELSIPAFEVKPLGHSVSADGTAVVGRITDVSFFSSSYIHQGGSVQLFQGLSLRDVSGDGSIAVGSISPLNDPIRVVNGVVQTLPTFSGFPTSGSTISRDGSVIAGSFTNTALGVGEAAIYDDASGWRSLQTVLQQQGITVGQLDGVSGIADDGLTFVGLDTNLDGFIARLDPPNTFRWDTSQTSSGLFDDASHWIPQKVPTSIDTVFFDTELLHEVSLTQPEFSRDVNVSAGEANFLLNGNTYTVSDAIRIGLTSDSALINPPAELTVDGGTVRADDVAVGAADFASGRVTVKPGATLEVDPAVGEIRVGGAAGSAASRELINEIGGVVQAAKLMIGQGGSVNSPNLASIGDLASAGIPLAIKESVSVTDGGTLTTSQAIVGGPAGIPGVVRISGAGSSWSIVEGAGLPDVLTIGSGDGEVEVSGGGSLSASVVHIGRQVGDQGRLTISDGGSQLTSAAMSVGETGTGTVTVQSGGQLRTDFLSAGVQPGASAQIIVQDVGSTWTSQANGTNNFGVEGRASLSVLGGARVDFSNSRETAFGSNVGGIGTALIEGGGPANDFELDVLKLVVGDRGQGTLLARNGARVRAGELFIGRHTPLTNGLGSGFALDASHLEVFGSVDIGGATNEIGELVLLNSSTANIDFLLNVSPGGTVRLDSTSTLTANGGNIASGGVLSGDGQANFPQSTLLNNGLVSGNLGVAADVFVNGGTGRIGNSPGIITVDGEFIQLNTGLLEVEIGGYIPIIQHDVLDVTGDVTLGGELSISFIDDFVPLIGDEFVFLNFGGQLSGQFDTITINGFDGAPISVQSDGQSLRFVAASAAVPEPASLAIWVLLALGLAGLRYYRRSPATTSGRNLCTPDNRGYRATS